MSDSTAPDIRFEDVSTSLGGQIVHQRLRADLPAGEITVLMGPSGGGKTTLVRHLVGLLPPDSGRVVVGGRSVWDLDPKQLTALRAGMGVLLGGSTGRSASTRSRACCRSSCPHGCGDGSHSAPRWRARSPW